jgi:hypothetical protein
VYTSTPALQVATLGCTAATAYRDRTKADSYSCTTTADCAQEPVSPPSARARRGPPLISPPRLYCSILPKDLGTNRRRDRAPDSLLRARVRHVTSHHREYSPYHVSNSTTFDPERYLAGLEPIADSGLECTRSDRMYDRHKPVRSKGKDTTASLLLLEEGDDE